MTDKPSLSPESLASLIEEAEFQLNSIRSRTARFDEQTGVIYKALRELRDHLIAGAGRREALVKSWIQQADSLEKHAEHIGGSMPDHAGIFDGRAAGFRQAASDLASLREDLT